MEQIIGTLGLLWLSAMAGVGLGYLAKGNALMGCGTVLNVLAILAVVYLL